jgi:hypothetical protein
MSLFHGFNRFVKDMMSGGGDLNKHIVPQRFVVRLRRNYSRVALILPNNGWATTSKQTPHTMRRLRIEKGQRMHSPPITKAHHSFAALHKLACQVRNRSRNRCQGF